MRKKYSHKELATLWEAIKNEDANAFQQLFEMLYVEMLAFGLTIHFARPAVKDAIQDVFFEIWQKRNNLPAVRNHPAYLKQILKRKLLKIARNAQSATPATDNAPIILPYETLLIQQQKNLETQERLKNAFQQLSRRQREIIQLRFFHGMSYDDIASQTDTRKRTVYNQVHTALKILKKAMLLHLLFFLS